MPFINYLLASIIAYLGLIVGMILIKIAPEEQKPGRKYFSFLKHIFFVLIITFLYIFYLNNIVFILLLTLFFIIYLLLDIKIKIMNLKKLNKINESNKSLIIYIILAIIFYLSYRNVNLFVIESSLIFLYGIPNASLLFNMKTKNYMEILSKHILFIIIALSLFLIF